MPKQVGMISAVALALVLYLIWKDPTGTAEVITGFFSAVGGFLGDLWDKLGQFLQKLIGS